MKIIFGLAILTGILAQIGPRGPGLPGPGLQDSQDRSRILDLISSLDGLPETCSLDQFLNRPALMELSSLVDRSAPLLGTALETSPSWSIRASAAFILAQNGFFDGPSTEMTKGWASLLSDPSPFVQLIAARTMSSEKALEMLGQEPLRTLFDRFPVDPSGEATDWLPDGYFSARLGRYLELTRTMDPYASALPTWEASLDIKESVLGATVGDALAQAMGRSARGHEVSEALYQAFLTQPAQDVARRDFLLNLVRVSLSHSDASHGEAGGCPDAARFLETRFELAERLIWGERDPYAVHTLVFLLSDLGVAGHRPALEILRRLTVDHPDEHVRKLATGELVNAHQRLASAAKMADLDRRRRTLPPKGLPILPVEAPPGPPGSPASENPAATPVPGIPPEADSKASTRYFGIGVVLFLLVLGILVAQVARARRKKTI